MGQHLINLFMWGYQPHFRLSLEVTANRIFELLDLKVETKVFLVGARAPDSQNTHPVCIEPEDGEWPLSLFEHLLESVESNVNNHRLKNMFYGDKASMRDKPENIRRDSVTSAVTKLMNDYDTSHKVNSFCGYSYPVDGYYVVPVIQIPDFVFEQFPPLKKREVDLDNPWDRQGYRGFIHAIIQNLLYEATEELKCKEPGRFIFNETRRSEDEIVRKSASDFLHTPGLAIDKQYIHDKPFERINQIASMMYEGVEGTGNLILANPDNKAIEYLIRFKTPVKFIHSHWARKILQMATKEIALVADSKQIYGLGKLNEFYDPGLEDIFIIDFIDHYHWELHCGGQVLLRSHYGEPRLPQEPISQSHFLSNYARLFPQSSIETRENIWALFNCTIHQNHGSMIVIAEDAEEEAARLERQGTNIEPIKMTPELLKRVSGIDGTILLDPHGICHAIGIILDGMAVSTVHLRVAPAITQGSVT